MGMNAQARSADDSALPPLGSLGATQPLLDFIARFERGEIEPAAFAAGYFVIGQSLRGGKRCASRRRKSSPPPNPSRWLTNLAHCDGPTVTADLADWIDQYQFTGVVGSVSVALAAWLAGRWPLRLLTHVPTPRGVLAMQAEGVRPVTAICAYPDLLRPALGKADGFHFLIHDLEHAYHFYRDDRLHRGQRRLFRSLQRAIDQGTFADFLVDSVFHDKFAYLISDMNTHPLHSLRYLCAILIEARLRLTGRALTDSLEATEERGIAAVFEQLGAELNASPAALTAFRSLVRGPFDHEQAHLIETAFCAA